MSAESIFTICKVNPNCEKIADGAHRRFRRFWLIRAREKAMKWRRYAWKEAASKEKGIPTIPQLIGGEWQPAAETAEVRDPYRGTVIARAPRSGMDDLERAVAAAVRAKPVMAAMPGYKRAELAAARCRAAE
jgi:hypothetical protein